MTRQHVRRVVCGLAAATLVATGAVACGSDSGDSGPRSVTVIGNGKVTGTPDTLQATIGVQVQGADVSGALNETSGKVKAVTDAVSSAGVERKDIQTQQVSLEPRYTSPAPGGAGQISGYEATNSLRITIRDTSKASVILAAAANAGGDNTRISGVSFSIDDDTALLNKAREAAFNDARSRADQYAKLAGDRLGKVLAVTETTSGQQGAEKSPAMNGRAVAPVPTEPGQQTTTFAVTVKYALN
ncbi:MAG: SIMPL domain-containing protein [Nocardia sp.]|nr:SIMPL domain-containing protein [Nocardia sp.]